MMRAKYRTVEGLWGHFEHQVIVPQESESNGGFTLVGFRGFEELSEGKMCAAITGLVEFELEDGKIGF